MTFFISNSYLNNACRKHRLVLLNRHYSALLSRGTGVFGALGQNEKLLNSNTFDFVAGGTFLFAMKSTIELCYDVDHLIILFWDNNSSFVRVAAGWGHSVALTKSGEVFVFGRPYEFKTLLRINGINKFFPFIARLVSRSTNSSLFNETVTTFVNVFGNALNWRDETTGLATEFTPRN